MPFEGPDGQGPFEDFDDCVDSMSDEEGIDDPEALCAAWEKMDQAAPTDAEYRQHFRADSVASDDIGVTEHDDETFSIRMPIASTGEVRNEDDDPLTREEIDGMAQQLADRQIGVFPAHGRDGMIAAGRYSPFEKLGYWDDGGVEEREESDDALLMANARLPDPDTLPELGAYREALGILKEQAKRGIAQDSSIGWRNDDSFPGGVDLMEASIVGIGADWRTNTATEAAMARAAVDAGADPEAFVDEVRNAVMGATDDEDEHMTDTETDDPPETVEHEGRTYVLREEGDATDDESDERQDAPEWAAEMLELLRDTNDTLGELADEIRQDDDDDDEEDDDEEDNETDEDEDEDDEDDENAQDVADLRAALDDLREGGVDVSDVDLPDADDEQDADDGESDAATPPEDPMKERLR